MPIWASFRPVSQPEWDCLEVASMLASDSRRRFLVPWFVRSPRPLSKPSIVWGCHVFEPILAISAWMAFTFLNCHFSVEKPLLDLFSLHEEEGSLLIACWYFLRQLDSFCWFNSQKIPSDQLSPLKEDKAINDYLLPPAWQAVCPLNTWVGEGGCAHVLLVGFL